MVSTASFGTLLKAESLVKSFFSTEKQKRKLNISASILLNATDVAVVADKENIK